jgi:uncharacterized membrane protein
MSLKMAVPLLFHELAVIVWIGGIFFSHFFLRPVLKQTLEPPARIQLALGVFRRFFPIVWLCILILWVTGAWVSIVHYSKAVGVHVMLMAGIALVMTLVFSYLVAFPYRTMQSSVDDENWRRASAKFSSIRKLMALNLVLGLTTVMVAIVGPAADRGLHEWLKP